jgi:hypothetical protein
VLPIWPSVGKPLLLAVPTSLPIILAYSICSAVRPAAAPAAPEDAVAMYQMPSTSSRISTDSKAALS